MASDETAIVRGLGPTPSRAHRLSPVRGSTHRTADATLRQSVTDLKHAIRIDWPLLSSPAPIEAEN